MKWDGYGASIEPGTTSLRHVVNSLSDYLQVNPVAGPSIKRWGQTTGFQVNNRLAAWVGWDEPSGAIYIEAKGETTPIVVKGIRSDFADHSAPRLDVAEDFDEEGAFPRLQGLVRAHKGPRVKGGYVALPDDDQDGKTWAAGVRGGVAFMRVYEWGKHPDRRHFNRPHAVRLELEARPHYARDKRAAARMSPQEVFGLTAWSHRVGQALTESEIARFEPEVRKYSFDKTTRYLALGFRRHWEEMIANGEDIKRTLQAVWEEEDQYRSSAG